MGCAWHAYSLVRAGISKVEGAHTAGAMHGELPQGALLRPGAGQASVILEKR